MPGTFGTLAGMPFVWPLSILDWYFYLAAVLVLFLIGIKVCSAASKAMQVHDHGSIVWDEIVGILITFFLIPISWLTLVLGFLLFRLFDIWKPWPISVLDKKVHGGFGIMLDDVLAGVFACASLHLILVYTPL